MGKSSRIKGGIIMATAIILLILLILLIHAIKRFLIHKNIQFHSDLRKKK